MALSDEAVRKLSLGPLLIGASALPASGVIATVLTAASGVGGNWVAESVGGVIGAGPPPDEALREAFRRAVQAAVKELRQAYTDERIRRDGADAFKLLREVARDTSVTAVPQGATEIVAVQRGLAGALGQLLHGFPEPQVQLVRERLLPATARAFQTELANDPKAWRLYHSWVLERLIQQSAALQAALTAQPTARTVLADASALEDRLDAVEERLAALLEELREELLRAVREQAGAGAIDDRQIAEVGSHTSTFVSPFQGVDLDSVLRALNYLQHPSSPLDAADIARIDALGLPTDSGMLAQELHQAVGSRLFSALTSDSAAARALASARDAAAHARLPLSLSLHLPQGAVTLAALPWELLWAEDEPTPLLLSRGPAGRLIRHLDLAHAFSAPRLGGRPLRVLAIAPRAGVEPAEREAERAARQAAWDVLTARGDVVLIPDLSPATPETLADTLRAQGGKLDVLHFIGHGTYLNGEGYLVLDGADGGWAPTPVSQLAPAIAAAGARLAVLSACQSSTVGAGAVDAGLLGGVAPALVAQGVPLVVAMQLTIRANAAQAATRVIYEQLAAGQSVPAAVAAARLHLWTSERDRASWYVPTLYVRARQASDEGLL